MLLETLLASGAWMEGVLFETETDAEGLDGEGRATEGLDGEAAAARVDTSAMDERLVDAAIVPVVALLSEERGG